MAGTCADRLLKAEFCCEKVNQECGFVLMYVVSCLDETLEHEFVRGDWLKGGNAYRCSKCDKKVT